MNKIVKDALILFAITLVAGVLLGFVYDITKDPIAAQNEKAKQEAYKEVMADADSFEALSGDAYSEANITATFAAALQADAENAGSADRRIPLQCKRNRAEAEFSDQLLSETENPSGTCQRE